MGEGDFAGLCVGAASDECYVADGVVGVAEGSAGDEPGVGVEFSCDRVYFGGFEGFA